jgi:hypothetical protein
MKRFLFLIGVLVWPWLMAAQDQLQLISEGEIERVFAGAGVRVALTWRHAGGIPLDLALRASVFQVSSATAIPLGERPWRPLRMLPGQTVLESGTIDLPEVKAETRFVIKWLSGSNIVVGTTEVLGYPTNLLGELKTPAGDEPPGVLDVSNALKPLLKAAGIGFADLADSGTDNYQGRLVIAGPFHNRSQMGDGLATQLRTLARRGVAVVSGDSAAIGTEGEGRRTTQVLVLYHGGRQRRGGRGAGRSDCPARREPVGPT